MIDLFYCIQNFIWQEPKFGHFWGGIVISATLIGNPDPFSWILTRISMMACLKLMGFPFSSTGRVEGMFFFKSAKKRETISKECKKSAKKRGAICRGNNLSGNKMSEIEGYVAVVLTRAGHFRYI